jgi:2-octaprenyl-6-methoxyphenol hydroxylase
MAFKETDILICGGGAPGLTLALLLARAGVAVTLVERSGPSVPRQPDGRTSAIMQGSINILKAVGGWESVAAQGETMSTLRIVDDSGLTAKPAQADFRAAEIGLDAFGVNMPNAVLTAGLLDLAVRQAGMTIVAPAELSALETDPTGITATVNGQTIRACLVVGADGRQSAVRTLAGIGVETKDYRQKAITCLINHALPHDYVSTEFHRPSGPFTLVPLPGNRSSVVWVDFNAPVDAFMAMRRQDFARTLQDRTRGILGETVLACEPSAWPLSRLKADRLTAPRVALIAEAAHVLHPLGAQGLNLSLRDAATLAETIIDALRLGQDPGQDSVLESYERKRRPDLAMRLSGTDGLNRLVSTDLVPLKLLRQAGMRTILDVPPLKRFAMRQGLAPRQDECRLARGENL